MKRESGIVILILLILIVPMVSAGFFQDLKNKITGEATTANVQMNLTVSSGNPVIYNMILPSATTLIDGPSPTFIVINFSANDSDGASNLLNTSASINISKAGDSARFNSSCAMINSGGFTANYTCNVTVWWFDGDGQWVVSANISDSNAHVVSNTTKNITINTLTGFVMAPPALNFSTLTPGTYNITPTNFLTYNNTGNQNIAGIQINATDLRGETTPGQAIPAANFSVSIYTGGYIECNITASAIALVNMTLTNLTTSLLPRGNFTVNDGNTGQERNYFCLRHVGGELTQQYYSTQGFGSWTVKIA
jgi:hypothetical protein